MSSLGSIAFKTFAASIAISTLIAPPADAVQICASGRMAPTCFDVVNPRNIEGSFPFVLNVGGDGLAGTVVINDVQYGDGFTKSSGIFIEEAQNANATDLCKGRFDISVWYANNRVEANFYFDGSIKGQCAFSGSSVAVQELAW